jgi:hypothetical protein
MLYAIKEIYAITTTTTNKQNNYKKTHTNKTANKSAKGQDLEKSMFFSFLFIPEDFFFFFDGSLKWSFYDIIIVSRNVLMCMYLY